ncbi:MAG: hypothetical protein Q8J85_07235 [Sulfuricurvum sp.]|nr:hypothetical protein [Sulfuricurvum sp.]MDP3022980.1 hypothetical protein [Sulfuricurvum sp.]
MDEIIINGETFKEEDLIKYKYTKPEIYHNDIHTYLMFCYFIDLTKRKFNLTEEEIAKFGIIEYFGKFYFSLIEKVFTYELLDKYNITMSDLFKNIQISKKHNISIESIMDK